MNPSFDRFQPPTAKEQSGGLELRECSECGEDFNPEREHQKLCPACELEEKENNA